MLHLPKSAGRRSALLLALALPGAAVMLPAPALADISFGLSIRIGYAPPPLPVYEQPPLPGPDYIWVPGHWAWSDWIDDYYWVPGFWERPPQVGYLWTPAWWGWDHGAYIYHDGYWGREVGWYGGIDFGFGYHGHGWEGGYWQDGHMAYNRAAVNVTNVTNINVTNVYYRPVTVINNNGPRVSYAGGQGGVNVQPTAAELRATQAPHLPPTPQQQQRVQQAATVPSNHASALAPAWHPPAVHRVSETGAPIPRSAALATGVATAGAPPAYQRPAGAPGQPRSPALAQQPRQAPQGQPGQGGSGQPRPAYGQAPGGQPGYGNQGNGQYGHGPGAQGAPQATPGGYQQQRTAPPQGYTPPHQQPMGQPAYGQQPHPAPPPAPHPAPPPPPRPAPPPPPPRPAPPPPPRPAPQQQQQHPHEHEHS